MLLINEMSCMRKNTSVNAFCIFYDVYAIKYTSMPFV